MAETREVGQLDVDEFIAWARATFKTVTVTKRRRPSSIRKAQRGPQSGDNKWQR